MTGNVIRCTAYDVIRWARISLTGVTTDCSRTVSMWNRPKQYDWLSQTVFLAATDENTVSQTISGINRGFRIKRRLVTPEGVQFGFCACRGPRTVKSAQTDYANGVFVVCT